MSRLAEQQRRFSQALRQRDPELAPPLRASGEDGFHAYAYAVWARMEESLAEDFPQLKERLGEEAFEELLERYLTAHPSRSPSLSDLGRELPRFLRAESAELAELARLEWLRLEVQDAGSAASPSGAAAGEPRLAVSVRLHEWGDRRVCLYWSGGLQELPLSGAQYRILGAIAEGAPLEDVLAQLAPDPERDAEAASAFARDLEAWFREWVVNGVLLPEGG
jgi:hypothetical protein